jgi:FixJ family two-component response regulator
MALTNSKKAEIIRYILMAGVSNREIARRVGCDEKTVRIYRGSNNPQIDIQVARGSGTKQSYTMRLTRDR